MKQTLELTLERAREIYPSAAPEFKKMLEDNFGAKQLKGNIIERTKTLEDACYEIGKNISTLFDSATDEYERAEIAIKTFAEALREGKPAGECFYYPYFLRSSAGGFSYYGCGYAHVYTGVGARLRVDTADKAKHLGVCMLKYYKTYLEG